MDIHELYNSMRTDVQAEFDNSKEWKSLEKSVKNFIGYINDTNFVVWLHDGNNVMWNDSKSPNEAFNELLQRAQNLGNENPLRLSAHREIFHIAIPKHQNQPIYFLVKNQKEVTSGEHIEVWEIKENPTFGYVESIWKWGYTFEQSDNLNPLLMHLLTALKINF